MCSFPALTLALRPTDVCASPPLPIVQAVVQRNRVRGPAGSEQLNTNLYLGQDSRKPRYSFCRL